MRRVLLAVACLLTLPYLRTSIYRFPAPAPFSGDALYSPYADVAGPWSGVTWQRTNFHAHSRDWNGLTHGRQSDEDVVAAYRSAGYDVPGLSNYQHISTPAGASDIPVYEHGYNIGKLHQLAIGARRVAWLDFPLLQLTSHKQQVIDAVARDADLVALAHPNGRISYSRGDLSRLTGYHLIEVANGPFLDRSRWDAALSAGRLVWGIGDDDNHDTSDDRKFLRAWTSVAAASASRSAIVDALRRGRFYATMRLDPAEPREAVTTVASVTLDAGTLTVTCAGAPALFEFRGQNGVMRKAVPSALTASYTFTPDDSYIRVTIWAPRHVYYLNPVVRWNGTTLPNPAAAINPAATWLARLACAAVAAACAVLSVRGRKPEVPRAA